MPAQKSHMKTKGQCGITAVILTLNEEESLPRCLSGLGWADRVVLVDSGSSDDTLKVAIGLGADVVVNKPYKFVISEQRNWALDNAGISTPWVLFVDADEYVTKELAEELCSIAGEQPPRFSAYRISPKYMFMGTWLKHTVPFPSWHDRFLRVGKVRYTGEVWEHFATAKEVGYVKGVYLHYGLSSGIGCWLRRHVRYAEWKSGAILSRRPPGPVGAKRAWYDVLEYCGTKLGPLSPVVRFFYYYIVRLGFLDGFPGLIYSLMIAAYQLMIYLFMLEKTRKMNGRGL